jgi:mannose/fructose/N-acetylgalactosamine-specific phosphotransferase system component IIB
MVLLAFFLLFVLGCLQFYNSILQEDILVLEQNATQKQVEINQYKRTIQKVNALKNRINTIEKKLSIIKELSFKRYNAIYLLNAITESVISKRMWFSIISFDRKMLKIQGLAMDERTVTDFMKKLEETKNWIWISDAFIKDLEKNKITKSILVKMSDLKNFQFFEDQEFEFVLDAVLGDQLTEEDKDTIMNKAITPYFSEVRLISTTKRTVEKDTHLTNFIIDCLQNTL